MSSDEEDDVYDESGNDESEEGWSSNPESEPESPPVRKEGIVLQQELKEGKLPLSLLAPLKLTHTFLKPFAHTLRQYFTPTQMCTHTDPPPSSFLLLLFSSAVFPVGWSVGVVESVDVEDDCWGCEGVTTL